MKPYKKFFLVELDAKTFIFYDEIAKITERPLEDILSDTLAKTAEIVSRKTAEFYDKGQ